MAEDFDVDEMLERWGLRIVGGTLKSPLRVSTGGEAMLDDDLRLVDYVESTSGYDRAAPVLKHIYSEGRTFGEFRLRLPGETREHALLRWGWFDLVGLRDAVIPARIDLEFRRELRRRLREQPYHPSAKVLEAAKA
jgi:hypothetical protein